MDPRPAQNGCSIHVNDIDVYFEESGSGEPLILLHGGSATLSMWSDYIPTFAQHFTVIAPDSRGHGRTDNPTGELNYRLMADDVASLIHALGLTKPFICGFSDGGQIALELGMQNPGLAAALAIGGASYKFSDAYFASLKSLGMQGPGEVDFEQIQQAFPGLVDGWKTAHWRADDPDYWQTLLRQISAMFWNPPCYSADDLRKVTDPTLIITGDRDELNDLAQTFEMYRLIPNAELAVLPNRSHMSTLGDLFADTVLDFLLRQTAL